MAIPFDLPDLTWLNLTASLDGGELRRADAALLAGDTGAAWGGIARHSDNPIDVTVNGSDVVTVNPGAFVIPGNAVAETGVYRGSLAALQTGSLAARNATNPRITLVVVRALDTSVVVGHAAYKGRIEFVDGTPAASPVAPALPQMAVELARITVPQTGGGTATVDKSFRTYATAAGGELIAPTLARFPASAAKYQKARDLATGLRYEWSGSAWTRLATENFSTLAIGEGGFALGTNIAEAGEGCDLYRDGGMGTLAVYLTATNTIAANATLLSIPGGYRPPRTIRGRMTVTDGTDVAVALTTGGSFEIGPTGLANGQLLYGTLAFPAIP